MSETLLNNRYRLIAQQGSGGMAVIYKAVDQELGRTVAVKILRPSLTKDPQFLYRFKDEARNVANLSHPNIVTVYDVGSDGPTNYIVMEFVDGQDLKRIIRTHQGPLPLDYVINISIQICAGIGLAHRAGLVHADVKPQNVLITHENNVKVTDFGIAQALSDTSPGQRADVVWGSPHYFAPEQARGERPSPASDVYSIGIVMFEMLTGRLPYTGADQQALAMAHIREEIPHVTEFNPNVPENLSRIVYKVMSKDPGQRYRMADQLGHILMSYRDRGQQHTAVNVSRVPGNDQVPPPPDQQFQRPDGSQSGRPLYRQPESASADPTQRYDVAPQAPSYASQPATPSPIQQNPSGYTGSSRGQTGGFPSSTGAYSQEDLGMMEGFDAITIILALLAFISVACLIPLYILVFQAYF